LAPPGNADDNNERVARLIEYGLFPQELRSNFAAELIEYCVKGVDPAVLSICHQRSGPGHPRFRTLGVRALVAEEDDPVAEGPGLAELEIDLGV
jgi:hypothetical protein